MAISTRPMGTRPDPTLMGVGFYPVRLGIGLGMGFKKKKTRPESESSSGFIKNPAGTRPDPARTQTQTRPSNLEITKKTPYIYIPITNPKSLT